MIVKIFGFKKKEDKSMQETFRSEVKMPPKEAYKGEWKQLFELELGLKVRIALEKSDFVSVKNEDYCC